MSNNYYNKVLKRIDELEDIEIERDLTPAENEELKCLYCQNDWFDYADKLRPLFKDVTDDLKEKVMVTYGDGIASGKSAIALTRKNGDGKTLTVGFDWVVEELLGLDDNRYNEILLHEMCHCAAFFTDGSLDHGKTWHYFVDKLNRSYSGQFEIKEQYGDDDVRIFTDRQTKKTSAK